ncbi:MAG: CBS domain-containing protein [Acidimicrobiales bacterium]
MQVSEILKKKGRHVATISPEEPIGGACDTLRSIGVGALVVSADGVSIDGIVSERDIVRALADAPSTDLRQRPCSEIMTSEVFTCEPNDRIEQLMSLMTERRIRHLPVVVDAQLTGIVSIGDIVKWRLHELEDETRLMEEYIHRGR